MADRSCAVVLRAGQILMVQQTHRGRTFWTLPGGGVEPGEAPEQAVVREVREETTLTVHVERRLASRPRTGSPGTYHCFLCTIDGGTAQLGGDPDLHSLAWVPLAEAAVHPEVASLLPSLAPPG